MSERRLRGKRAVAAIFMAAVAGAVTLIAGSAVVRGDVVISNFEDGQMVGWGALTNSGIKPWSDPAAGPSPANGAVITATNGPLNGSKVVELSGQASFNFGQSSGGALGFDFLSQPNLRQAFLDNSQLEFDWYAPPDPSTSSGYSQLFNIVLNSQGGGYTNVAGYSMGQDIYNQYYYTGYNGSLHHIVVDYSAYKTTVQNSANPDGGGWLQLGIQPNAGGGAPPQMWFDNFKLSIAANLWNVDADGNWSDGANWSPAAPNAAGMVASFDAKITAAHTVTVDSAQTAGQLLFNNTNKYTIAGTSTLTLDASANVGITVSNGSHDITAPLVLAKNASVAVANASDTLTLSNLQASTVSLTKTGAGTLAVNNLRAGAVAVNGGTVRVLPNGAAAGAGTVASLSVSGGGVLDLGDNDLVVQNTSVGSVKSMIAAGSLTATAAPPAGKSVGLGYAQGDDAAVAGLGGSLTGQSFTAADAIVKFTYVGDADLDGDVDGVDVGKWATNFTGSGGSTAKVWTQGDWDYDGDVDGVDVGKWATNFTGSGGGVLDLPGAQPAAVKILGDMGFTVVPEPASLGLIALGGLLLGRRGRGRRANPATPRQ
jgi:hypothetical protein